MAPFRSPVRADRVEFDGVLVVGAGLAGLSAALAAAPRRALVLSPVPLGDGCASAWAQGGMAAALADDDDPALHAADTCAAGAGLCEAEAVRLLTTEGPHAVRALAALGAPFDRRADGGFAQSLEAAHSRPRVARVGGDGAGRAIMTAVIATARAAEHVEIRESVRAVALLSDALGRVHGVLAQAAGSLVEIHAPAVVLASGGIGGLYLVTTDPSAVRGEGLAMAAIAGAEILDPEFVQFHPTAIDIGADPAPLATEALRGEGARLVDAAGVPFMSRYHPSAELAPRDVVARAIESERRAGRGAFLDARAPLIADVPNEFPTVFAACMAGGVDPRRQPIPVLPAVHYHMGGVVTDLAGATTLPGLFAAGECAATGVHGANRLASNSLLEAAVFGARAGRAARDAARLSCRTLAPAAPPDLPVETLADLRRRMSRDAGVVREAAGLTRLLAWLAAAEAVCGPALALTAARLVADSALARRESRGRAFPGRPSGSRRGRRAYPPDVAGHGGPAPAGRVSGGPLPDLLVDPIVRAALAEDLGRAGDITSQACIPAEAAMTARFAARKSGVLSGLACARLAFAALDPEVKFEPHLADGESLRPGEAIATVSGSARVILAAERTALNLMGRLSGIATLTAAYAAQASGTRARIIDTRKTTPMLRALEKYAVRCGGGANHRFGLDDAILIKDNHVAACGGVGEAVRRARAVAGHMVKLEVEVDSLDQLGEALEAGPDIVMLDNFSLSDLETAVALAAGRVVLEASGGVTLETVTAIARTGVDLISVGALTHSASVLDIGLDVA